MKTNDRVSAADHAAFVAEATSIRKTLRAIKKDRLQQFYDGGEWAPTVDQLATHRARIMPIRDRLRYWRTVLRVDDVNIKHPVRLWDSWNRLCMLTDLEITDLAYKFGDKAIEAKFVVPIVDRNNTART